MKTRWLLAAAALAALLSVGSWAEEEKDKLEGVKCPVSGKPVKEASAVEYKGAKVYFCCDGCPKEFEANTAKYAAKANHQLVATKQFKEVKCPLAGKDLNPDTAIEVAGVKVCFCCNGCKGKASKAEGDAQIDLIFNDKAFEKGFEIVKAE